MGVTFFSLDYVVTVDTELSDRGGLSPDPAGRKRLLPAHRAGRARPSRAAIVTSEEGGPAWSSWSPDRPAADLVLEPLCLATVDRDVGPLALESQ
jgi:hypothetical protein